jgi:hypothetical protein
MAVDKGNSTVHVLVVRDTFCFIIADGSAGAGSLQVCTLRRLCAEKPRIVQK